ncbi:hypothetical protein [Pectobacterium brasiliense]|uniref:hypothetical protein n=1 Tax=Pectobacterium brasiliense TaxID=180957 RepID=UPI0019693D10|nr:hypothetical protein [Pectobacterium brasiliense]MBN3171844.1 hypothetical protein [Pectobacterium brasiliense]
MNKDDMGIDLVPRDSIEWHSMWATLGQHSANRNIPKPTVAENFGEVWQYMHTCEVRYCFFWKRYYHFFRHRMHPTINTNCGIKIPASKGFDSTNLVRSFTP